MSRCPDVASAQIPSRPTATLKVLVAGIGNVLRGDDGFGPAVVRALLGPLGTTAQPLNVRAVELGIGGINLVRELMDGYNALIIVDVVDRGGAAGTLYVLEPQVPDPAVVPAAKCHGLIDLHQALPGNALVLAQAAGVLPPVVRIIGCQPASTEEFSTALSPAVRETVPAAVEAVVSFLQTLNNPCFDVER